MPWLWPSLSLLLAAGPQPVTCAPADALARALPAGVSVQLQAVGDLDGDGRDECAVLVERRDGQATWRQLFLLRRTTEGGLEAYGRSREGELGHRGNFWTEDLRIAKGSLFVQNNTAR